MKRMTLYAARNAKTPPWSQEKLEAVSGVDQRNISRIERGETSDPRISTVEKLEDALGVKRGTLIFGREAIAS